MRNLIVLLAFVAAVNATLCDDFNPLFASDGVAINVKKLSNNNYAVVFSNTHPSPLSFTYSPLASKIDLSLGLYSGGQVVSIPLNGNTTSVGPAVASNFLFSLSSAQVSSSSCLLVKAIYQLGIGSKAKTEFFVGGYAIPTTVSRDVEEVEDDVKFEIELVQTRDASQTASFNQHYWVAPDSQQTSLAFDIKVTGTGTIYSLNWSIYDVDGLITIIGYSSSSWSTYYCGSSPCYKPTSFSMLGNAQLNPFNMSITINYKKTSSSPVTTYVGYNPLYIEYGSKRMIEDSTEIQQESKSFSDKGLIAITSASVFVAAAAVVAAVAIVRQKRSNTQSV